MGIGRDLALVALGSVLGLLLEHLRERLLHSEWARRRRATAAATALIRTPAQFEDGWFNWHGVRIRQMQGLLLRPLAPTAIAEWQVDCIHTEQSRTLDPSVRALVEGPLADRIAARKAHAMYHDDQYFALDGLTFGRSSNEQDRATIAILRTSATDYETFVSLNLMLDELVEDGPAGPRRVRDVLRLPPGAVDGGRLAQLPLHTKIGTSTLASTSDQQLVLTARPDNLMVARGGRGVRLQVLAVGEGMLLADSTATGSGLKPAPFMTVRRALERELLVTEDDYERESIRLLGICFDHQRYQPLLVFGMRLGLTSAELRSKWSLAADSQEHLQLCFIDSTSRSIRHLLAGEAVDCLSGRSLEMASNQGEMTVFLGGLYFNGLTSMRAAFS